MKRLILLCTFLLFIIASCADPVGQLGNDSKNSPDNTAPQATYNASAVLGDSLRQEAWEQFKIRNGSKWKISWSQKSGTPSSVFSGTTESIPGPPEQSARTFLAQNRSLFNMDNELKDLELMEVDISSRGNSHVRFQQMYKGVPVFKGDYQVHIRPDGRVDMANGHYYPDIEVSTSPSVSAASAVQTAKNDLSSQVDLTKDPQTTLMIYREPEEEAFRLAWRIVIEEPENSWRYFVDANNGQVLEELELSTSITGDGDIIEETTCTTPNPVNRNLHRLDGSGYLSGTYANVKNDEISRAYSSINSFQYSQENTHFDEVNVYRHIDIYRATYADDLGFSRNIGSDQDLEALVHYQANPNGAGYYPSNEQVRFGDQVDFARQDEVIYHEFVHAMADAENGSHYLDPNNTEEGAIGEGIADYFPGSYTGDATIGDCVLLQPRDMNNPDIATYDQYLNEGDVEEHDGGEFFSAVLWDLRNSGGISQHDADILVFEAISRLSGEPNFLEYRNAMMAVDSDINGGVHNDLIQNNFADRGVGMHVPPSVSITGPSNLWEGTSDTFTANVSGGESPYQYQWYYKHETDSNWTLVSGETSSTYTHTAGSPSGEYVRVVVTDNSSAVNESVHFFTIIGAA